MNILCKEKHVYGIVLALPKPNIAFKTTIVTKCQILNSGIFVCLPICLIIFKRLEAKQHNTWSPNFAAITNSPLECAFSGYEVCLLSVPCSFVYLQDCGHLLHVTKP